MHALQQNKDSVHIHSLFFIHRRPRCVAEFCHYIQVCANDTVGLACMFMKGGKIATSLLLL